MRTLTPQSEFNVPVFFWMSFIVAFGVVAVAPVWQAPGGRVPNGSTLFLASAYDSLRGLPWKPALMAHVLVATIVATLTTVVVHSLSNQQPATRQIRLRSLVFLTTAFAAIGAVIPGGETLPWVFASAMIPLAGFTIACVIAAKIRPNDGFM